MEDFEDDVYIVDDLEYTNEVAAAELADEISVVENKTHLNDLWNRVGTFLIKVKEETKARTTHWWCRHRYPELSRFMLRLVILKKDANNNAVDLWVKESQKQLGLCIDCMEGYRNALGQLAEDLEAEEGKDVAKKSMQVLVEADAVRLRQIWTRGAASDMKDNLARKTELTMALFELLSSPRMLRDHRFIKPLNKWISDAPHDLNDIDMSTMNALPGLYMLTICPDSALRSWSAQTLLKFKAKQNAAIMTYMEELMFVLENDAYNKLWTEIDLPSTHNFGLFVSSGQCTNTPIAQVLWAGMDTLFQALEESSAQKLLERFNNLPDLVFTVIQEASPFELHKLPLQGLLVVVRCYRALLATLRHRFWEHAAYDPAAVLEVIIGHCKNLDWKEFIGIGFLDLFPAFLVSLRPLLDDEIPDEIAATYFNVRKKIFAFLLKSDEVYEHHPMLKNTAVKSLYAIVRDSYNTRPTSSKSLAAVKDGDLPDDQIVDIVTPKQTYWWPHPIPAVDEARNSSCFASEWMEHLMQTLKTAEVLQLVDAAAATISLVIQKHMYLIRDTLIGKLEIHGLLSSTWLLDSLCSWKDVEKIPLTVHAALFECVGITAQLSLVVPDSAHLAAFQERLAPYVTLLTDEITNKGLYNLLKIPAVAQHITLCYITTHPVIRFGIKRLIVHGALGPINDQHGQPQSMTLPYQTLVQENIPSFCRGMSSVLLHMRSQGLQIRVLKEIMLHWTLVYESLPDKLFHIITTFNDKMNSSGVPLVRFPRLVHDFFCRALEQSAACEESYGVRLLRFVKQMWRFWWMFQPKKHKCTQYPGNRMLIVLLRYTLLNPSVTIQKRVVDLAMFIVGELSHARDYASFRLDSGLEQDLLKLSNIWMSRIAEIPPETNNLWDAAQELGKLSSAIQRLSKQIETRRPVKETTKEFWRKSTSQKSQYDQTKLFGWIQTKSAASTKEERTRARHDKAESVLEALDMSHPTIKRTSSKHVTTKMTSETTVNATSRQDAFFDDINYSQIMKERKLLQDKKAAAKAQDDAVQEQAAKSKEVDSSSTGNRSDIQSSSGQRAAPKPLVKRESDAEIKAPVYKILPMVRHIRGMRKPIAPGSLIPFFRHMLLAAETLADQEEASALVKPPINFDSGEEYMSTFVPLLVEECKSEMVESWARVGSLQQTRLRYQSEQSRENLRILIFSMATKQFPPMKNHDVLYLSGVNNTDAFAGVFVQPDKKDKSKPKGERELHVLILGSEDMTQDLILNSQEEFDAKVLCSLTTGSREYLALMSLNLMPAHLLAAVLKPDSCKSIQSTLVSMVADFEKYKATPGESSTSALKRCLKQLSKMNVQLEDLRVTNIGVAVKKLKKYKNDETVGKMAMALVQRWSKLLMAKDDLLDAPAFVPQALWDVVKPMYNQSQLQSIHSVLSNYDTGVSLLQGPPGTGKTKTILGLVSGLLSVELPTPAKLAPVNRPALNFNAQSDQPKRVSIQQIKNQQLGRQRLVGAMEGRSSRMGLIQRVSIPLGKSSMTKSQSNHILICAPSNGAVDELISRLLADGLVDPTGNKIRVKAPSIRRQGQMASDFNDIPEPHLSIIRLGATAEDAPSNVKDVCLKAVVQRNIKNHPKYVTFSQLDKRENELRGFIRKFHAEKDPEKKKDKKQMTLWHRELSEIQGKKRRIQEEVENLREQMTTDLLTQANIIACTLSKCGSGDLNPIARGFDAVIIDEAAQAVEVSTLIPLRERVARVIFVGDPKQLPATVKSVRAQNFQYNRSLFERLAEGGVPRSILRVQYRMHPFLREFPSKCFYGGILNDGPVIGTRLLALGDKVYQHPCFQPFLLFDVQGRESSGSGGSKFNMDEAEFGMSIVKALYEKISLVRSKQWSVGFITPYKEQVLTLRRLTKERGFLDVEVNTVDGFQGREKDIIIFSCVRTQSIGFLRDIRRLNVGMTRARYCCFVLGDVHTLKKDPTWRQLVESASDRRLLIPAGRRRFEEVVERMDNDADLKGHFDKMHAHVMDKFTQESNVAKEPETKRKRSASPPPGEREPKEQKTEPPKEESKEPMWNMLAKATDVVTVDDD
ncbi:Aste57867_3966 [Aphanomyces stellatus]|uniref:Aste57867_3966 protein n=1 Tax=Aphanomyces stellatus TaxID=120398 RepID=A0A485KG19_9STRA|nr:hypothetical protein As57867_003955 [Aphanomyces stellatus]VFT81103.1 Aste57867_3966 [Aphanomyces stellatus]